MYQHATKIGAIALAVWSFGPLFNSLVAAVPVFEILTATFGLGFILGSFYQYLTGGGQQLNQPLKFWLVGFSGVFGNELLFVSAFKYAPAGHIILLNYLWPLLVVSLTGFIRNEKFSFRYLFAALIGFASVAFFLLLNMEKIILAKYWIGYGLVIMGTCLWSIYTLVNKNTQDMPSQNITQYFGLGFIISLVLHLTTETFYLPNMTETMGLFWLGLMGLCLAFNLWDFGVKYGNLRSLSVLSYNNVLLSSLILMIFSRGEYKYSLLIAASGIMVASLLTVTDGKYFKKLFNKNINLPEKKNF